MRFFLISQGSPNPKIRFLGQKVWPVACAQTDTHTDRHTDRHTEWLLRTPFQGFRIFSFNLSSRIGPKIVIKSVKMQILNISLHYFSPQRACDGKWQMLSQIYIYILSDSTQWTSWSLAHTFTGLTHLLNPSSPAHYMHRCLLLLAVTRLAVRQASERKHWVSI